MAGERYGLDMSQRRIPYGAKSMPSTSYGPDYLPHDGERMSTMRYLYSGETLRVQELHYGIVHVAESPTPRHQRLAFRLAQALSAKVEADELGEVFIAPLDVVLDQARDLVVQPDVFFVSKAQAHIVTDRVWGAPDLVVEVLSPRPRIGSLEQRIAWFAGYGVRECWLVHQMARQIEILRFDAGAVTTPRLFGQRDQVTSGVIPGLDIRLIDLITTSYF
jgi:Uma2 family endonuclease